MLIQILHFYTNQMNPITNCRLVAFCEKILKICEKISDVNPIKIRISGLLSEKICGCSQSGITESAATRLSLTTSAWDNQVPVYNQTNDCM